MSNTWEMGLSPLPFTNIIAGKKTIEVRLNRGKFTQFAPGDVVKLRRDYYDEHGVLRDGEFDAARVEVVAVRHYPTFLETVTAEGYEKVIPYASSAQVAADEYNTYYSAADQARYGVLAIEVIML